MSGSQPSARSPETYHEYYQHEIQKNFRHSPRLEVEIHSLPPHPPEIVLVNVLLPQIQGVENFQVSFQLLSDDFYPDIPEYVWR